MKKAEISTYLSIYRKGLLEDNIPFWIRYSIDKEYGGFMFAGL